MSSSTTPSAVNIPPSASSFAVVFIDNPLLQIEIASVYQKSLLKKSGSIACLHERICRKYLTKQVKYVKLTFG